MQGREFKDLIFEQFAKVAQAFSAPKRLEIIDILAQGERDVDSLSRQVSMTIANTSRHLQILKQARLAESRREGVRIIYRLADDDVVQCWMNLQLLAEKRSSEIREVTRMFFEERDTMEPITKNELLNLIQNNEVIVLDVRPAVEYKTEHISGALSIPLSELNKRINEIPKSRNVIAYCRGKYCVLSAEAMSILKSAGIKAIRLKDGFPEWKQAGLPVE